MPWSPSRSCSPEPEPEPELEREDPPNGSPTWWTSDSERMSPARLPRDRSPRGHYHARMARDLDDYDIENEDEDHRAREDLNCDSSYYNYPLGTYSRRVSSPIADGLPFQEAEETSPVADANGGGDRSGYGGEANIRRESLSGRRVSSPIAVISSPEYDEDSDGAGNGNGNGGDGGGDGYGGGGNNTDDSDEEENVGGNRVATRTAKISPQFGLAGAVGGGGGNGVNGGGNDSINTIDVCPICYEPCTYDGGHRTCCLPCGHIYGLSCIQKCLQLDEGSGKCPVCKRAYAQNDVRVHYASPDATRLCAADVVNATPKTHFPFTAEGFNAFQHYVFSRNEALEQRVDALEKRANTLDRRPDALEQRVHELELHSNALDLQVYDILP